MKKMIGKTINFILVMSLVVNIAGLSTTSALAVPQPPSAPSAPSAPSVPNPYTTPTPTPTPVDNNQPETNEDTSTTDQSQTVPPTGSGASDETTEQDSSSTVDTQPEQIEEDPYVADQQSQIEVDPTMASFDDVTGEQESNGGMGDTVIDTGDAFVNAGITTQANTNIYDGTAADGSSELGIEGNGADSTNGIDVDLESDETIDQDNNLILHNLVDVDAVSGDNTISKNTGGSSTINSGDAQATVNVFNFGNSNFANVAIAEFDVYDNNNTDIYLDGLAYQPAEQVSADIDENGAGSDNQIVYGNDTTQLIFQNNNAEVTNDVNIEVNTGDNTIDKSMGDASITTGDANVVANIVNFLNTNFVGVGNLLVGVINLWEDYSGDIYLPDMSGLAFSDPSVEAGINGNGSNSNNQIGITDTDSLTLNQSNVIQVLNNVDVDANTGDNKTNLNTGGAIGVNTGDVNTTVTASTVAGQNFYSVGDYVQLVFVNNQGVITPYYMAADGSLVAVPLYYADISDNGAYSENLIAVSESDETVIDQTNTAIVTNNLNIDANTGGNEVTKNTNGNVSVETGDVSVLASISNFIGNNFVGKNLVITFINSLGEWTGNLLPSWMKPGPEPAETEEEQELAQDEQLGQGQPGEPTQNATDTSEQDQSNSNENNQQEGYASAQTGSTQSESSNNGASDQSQNSGTEESTNENIYDGIFGLLGLSRSNLFDSSTDEETTENQNEESTPKLFRPTLETTGTPIAAFDLGALNPLKVIALAGLIVYANGGIKKKLIEK